jgi:hypothetical protein
MLEWSLWLFVQGLLTATCPKINLKLHAPLTCGVRSPPLHPLDPASRASAALATQRTHSGMRPCCLRSTSAHAKQLAPTRFGACAHARCLHARTATCQSMLLFFWPVPDQLTLFSPSWRLTGPWAEGLQRRGPNCNTIPYHTIPQAPTVHAYGKAGRPVCTPPCAPARFFRPLGLTCTSPFRACQISLTWPL